LGGEAVAGEVAAAAAENAELTLPLAIERALDGEHLAAAEAEALMGRIMAGEATPAQIGAYLAALRAKGPTVQEIAGFARAMRACPPPGPPRRRPLIDTCGPGGARAQTFNISTTAAFVAAGAGWPWPSTATARCPAVRAAPTCCRRWACAWT
jgi:anthranilate phosphoribosyltransferase